MKKRLLSAALALAMVLTLLPVSVFAASTSSGNPIRYYTKDANPNINAVQTNGDGWYYVQGSGDSATYTLVNDGVVTNTGAWTNGSTGTYFENVETAIGASQSGVKLIGATVSDTNPIWVRNNFTVDLNGKSWTASGGIKITNVKPEEGSGTNQLTIQDSSGTRGTVNVTSNNIVVGSEVAAGHKDATVTLNNVQLTGQVLMYQSGSGVLNVTNSTVNGAIWVCAVPTTAGGNASTNGTVNVSGSLATVGEIHVQAGNQPSGVVATGGTVKVTDGATASVITLTASTGGTVTVDGGAKVTGAVTVTSDSGAVVNVGTTATKGTVGGLLTLTSKTGGTVTANSASINGVTMTGSGTKLNATSSNVGAVTINGSTDTTLADTKDVPSVTISGRAVDGNSAGDIVMGALTPNENVLKKPFSLIIKDDAKVGSVTLRNAEAYVTGSDTGAVIVYKGELTVTGSSGAPASLGKISLGSSAAQGGGSQGDGSATLKIVGTNVKTGNIEEVSGNVKTITVNIPSSSANEFGTITKQTDWTHWTERTILGGKFATEVDADSKLLSNSLRYQSTEQSGKTAYYTSDQINALVADYQAAASKPTVRVVGTKITGVSGLTAGNGAFYLKTNESDGTSKDALLVFFDDATTFILPTMVSSRTVQWWTKLGDITETIKAGTSVSVEAKWEPYTDENGNSTGRWPTFVAQNETYTIRALTSVMVDPAGPNPGVKAELRGNVIYLTGSVEAVSGTASIDLLLSTDIYSTVKTTVSYDPYSTNPSPNFSYLDAVNGITRNAGRTALLLVDGTSYTVNISGLKVPVENLELASVASRKAVVDVSRLSNWNEALKPDLKASMEKTTGAGVDFKDSPAVLQAIGAVRANITQQQRDNWLREGKVIWWKSLSGNANKTPQDSDLVGSPYNRVVLVPYMNVVYSNYDTGNDPGTLTATMTPYYRIEVWSATGEADTTNEPIVIPNTARSLGTLTGEMGKVTIKLPVEGAKFKMTGAYAHQNSTYVYPVNTASNANNITITHAANSGEGFGTIVIDAVKPLVKLENTKGTLSTNGTSYFDTLQAAVDDAADAGVVTISDGYKGSTSISVTGRKRNFTIKAEGTVPKLSLTNASGATLTPNNTNTEYTVQLAADTAVKPAEKPIPISTVSVTGGSVSLSASRADEGDTITVTLVPATGYTAGGITVRTDTGANVSYTATGTNTYRFVVPTGAKSITVTPSFTRTNTGVLVTVASATYGTATTTAGTNRVAVGSTVSVTVSPRSGYRTMGLYVTSDTGVSATAYRTGVNTFTFTVPSATSSVVVTPRFDVNNGTVFEDVWSTEYYSAPVAWAVGRGITDGTDTYHFSPGQSCNRVQMVTFMWRAAGRPSTAGMANPFYDVSPSMGNDFYNAILWANAKGITNGDGSTTRFNPYKTVTRAEAVTFLWRYEGKPAASTNSGFYDVPAREWYAQAVTWAVGKGITNGDGSTVRFNPNGACLRAQIVTFLYRDITGARA